MPETITFQGQLWRISQDHEGETKVTLCFSLSELHKVLMLGTHTQKRLKVTIEVDE